MHIISKKIFILFFISIITAFTWGVISTYKQLFPFNQLIEIKKIASKINPSPDTTLNDYPYYRDRSSLFSSVHSVAKNVMVGDSITDGAEWNELLPNASIVNRGISNDTTYGVKNRLTSIISAKPLHVFIMIGINDITQGRRQEKIIADYIEIVEKLQENEIKPFVQSIIYVGENFKNSAQINNTVQQINTKLSNYANSKNIIFIDLNKELSNNHALKPSMTTDNLHLNGHGYIVWKKSIEKYIQK